MKIKISITKEVLKESMYCSNKPWNPKKIVSQNCAIGKAICKLFDDKSIVEATKIYFFKDGLHNSLDPVLRKITKYPDNYVSLPLEAVKFISEFDKSTPEERVNMKPFSFEIDIPSQVIEWIGIGETYKVLSESKTLELVEI